jgi:hypothetical protein
MVSGKVTIIIAIPAVRKLRLREVKEFAQDHSANVEQG